MKAINIKINNGCDGKMTLNGVSGFYTANKNREIWLIYTTGMMIFVEYSDELMNALNEKFK